VEHALAVAKGDVGIAIRGVGQDIGEAVAVDVGERDGGVIRAHLRRAIERDRWARRRQKCELRACPAHAIDLKDAVARVGHDDLIAPVAVQICRL